MRKKYEKPSDLKKEKAVAEKYGEYFDLEMNKLGELFCADYQGWADFKEVCIVEIKCRENAHDKYDDYMISEQKVLKCQEYSGKHRVGFYLVVRFTDGVYQRRIKPEDMFKTRIGGRNDRNDEQDMETVCLIPMNTFFEIELR